MSTARLLFFTGPQSQNTTQVELHKEFESLKNILEKQQAIELLLPTLTGKYSDLVRLLAEKDGPDLLHFAGHGHSRDLMLLNENNQQTRLGLEDATKLFAHCPQMGVVLNACSSARIAESISGSVRFAVGYRGKLLDEVAISFTKSFYRGLSGGKMLADAFEIAVLESGGSGLHPDTKPIIYYHRDVDPQSYRVGPSSEKHSRTDPIAQGPTLVASQRNSMSKGSSEQQGRQIGPEPSAASNEATSETNYGLAARQIINNGSMTIINNNGYTPNPLKQDKVAPPSYSDAKIPNPSTLIDSSQEERKVETLPHVIRSHVPMPLTDDDWTRLKLLQTRLKVDAAGRRNMLFKIVGQKSNNDPFAAILQISGDGDFFEALDNLWITIQDNELIDKYIQALEPLTINGTDQLWIRELIERIGRVPTPPKETDILFNAVSGILKRSTDDHKSFESVYRSIHYRDREMVARQINQEFNLCPALAQALITDSNPNEVKDQVVEQFVDGEKPADWLFERIQQKYTRGTIDSDDVHRGLKRLLFFSLIVQMPPDMHELLSIEILRVKSNDTGTSNRHGVQEKDVGTRDKEFITLSIATAISVTTRDLSSNNEFLIDIVQELMEDDWNQKLKERYTPSRIKPIDFATEEKRVIYDTPAIRSRNLDENLKFLCKDLLDVFSQKCYPSQSEIDVLNELLHRRSQPDDSNLHLYALILPVEYSQGLIGYIRDKLPKLLVIPVSNRREKEFQYLRVILDQTIQILDSARLRK